MSDLRDALTRQGFEPLHLDLEPDEAATLMSLLQLGMDALAAKPLDIDALLRLHRMPDSTLHGLGTKLAGSLNMSSAKVVQLRDLGER